MKNKKNFALSALLVLGMLILGLFPSMVSATMYGGYGMHGYGGHMGGYGMHGYGNGWHNNGYGGYGLRGWNSNYWYPYGWGNNLHSWWW